MKSILVAAGIIRNGSFILAAQRRFDDDLSLKWEFPGGKVEIGETSEECIVRELFEEFGIQTKVIEFFAENIYSNGIQSIHIQAFYVEHISGNIQLNVHENIKWVNISELDHLDWAPADIKLVELLMQNYNN